ncbi:hypothetical protein CMV_021458 [Castanea mollissima]|uniref:Uncharacterized protein n=1 Tax=Castanea mollissima TaxID=60419 RepID=A0A8J4VKL5_9ROSI|nr:hypothetical protein CMV_021458 [Castanea mollissima]
MTSASLLLHSRTDFNLFCSSEKKKIEKEAKERETLFSSAAVKKEYRFPVPDKDIGTFAIRELKEEREGFRR